MRLDTGGWPDQLIGLDLTNRDDLLLADDLYNIRDRQKLGFLVIELTQVKELWERLRAANSNAAAGSRFR